MPQTFTRSQSKHRNATAACWKPRFRKGRLAVLALTLALADTPLYRRMRATIRADEVARRKPVDLGKFYSGSEERNFQLRRAEEPCRGRSTDEAQECNRKWKESSVKGPRTVLRRTSKNGNDCRIIANSASAMLLSLWPTLRDVLNALGYAVQSIYNNTTYNDVQLITIRFQSF